MNNDFYQDLNKLAKKNAVVLFGSTMDWLIPVSELAQSFELNFKLYNRSFKDLSIKDAAAAFENAIKPICPGSLIIHIGENDLNLFKNNQTEFDTLYTNLIGTIKKSLPKARIGLVSLYNNCDSQIISEMNRHIKAVADSERCEFINIDNAKIWNPELSRQVISFVYNLGFENRAPIKKPLCETAKILYSYAYNSNLFQEELNNTSAVSA